MDAEDVFKCVSNVDVNNFIDIAGNFELVVSHKKNTELTAAHIINYMDYLLLCAIDYGLNNYQELQGDFYRILSEYSKVGGCKNRKFYAVQRMMEPYEGENPLYACYNIELIKNELEKQFEKDGCDNTKQSIHNAEDILASFLERL